MKDITRGGVGSQNGDDLGLPSVVERRCFSKETVLNDMGI